MRYTIQAYNCYSFTSPAIQRGKYEAYFIDENLARKFWSIFEEPMQEEIDVWHKNNWD